MPTSSYKRSREGGFRKLAMAFWETPKDSTIYGTMRFNVLKTFHFQDAVEKKFGVRPTLGQLMGRAVASAFEKTPEANAKIIWGKVYIKDTVDVYYQVDIEDGKDLSGVVIPDTGNKSIVEVCKELRQSARRLRSGEDDQYEKTQKGLLSRLPAWLLRIILFLLTFMEYNLGYTAKFLGAQPEPFGTVMVTNVGPFGIDIAYAPLVPPSRVPFIVLLGGLEERAWVSNGKVCIRPTICGNATIDHRILDGNKIGRLGKTIRAYMEDPYLFETSLGLESPWEGLDPPEGHPYCNFPHIEEAAES